MPEQLPPTPPRRPRRILIGVGAVLGIAVLTSAAFLLGRSGTEDSATPAPSPSATPPASPSVDVEFRPVAGVELPFSELHGPRMTTEGRAAGYSHSELGAAIAAVQVLARTSPSAGSDVFEPVLASQVTGTNLPAMKLAVADEYQRMRATTPVEDGAAISGNDATVKGFVVESYETGGATVVVVLDSAQLQAQDQLVSFTVQLIWRGNDWRVVAPPNGDWGAVATTLGAPPPGLRRYDT